ncbi:MULTISPECIES: superoxide dismutase family protein [unclassified Halomonas]|uniref:superoxide dismutase family protein n=1 Tax=unclassified Halomonas TaxID=2609666 RepID=UPI0007D960B9|nr:MULTISPECIES: superoxide dismutase family protein [unclassified Halomonas]MBT2786869.1 superoxide dismutase family protein [Halomonas sp. ISL-106]MBT2798478.1 superoxide dismutase family protein [Halomonas sp. ISL-104]OAL58149.1 superoxide dismutase [Halomonas sp. ALS9]
MRYSTIRFSTPLTAIAASLLLATSAAQANETLDVEMHKVSAEGNEASIGTVSLEHTDLGLLLTPSLTGLEPGVYGFHVHQNASCDPAENDSGEMTAALSAGGHYDPEETGTHQGPYGEGHLGDLPVLTVNEDGEANLPVLAPRLSMEDMPGRSLMIHEGGDTYADEPHLGGGGTRMACGVVES